MTALTPATASGRAAVDDAQESVRGEFIRPEDVGYDEHRKAWNPSAGSDAKASHDPLSRQRPTNPCRAARLPWPDPRRAQPAQAERA